MEECCDICYRSGRGRGSRWGGEFEGASGDVGCGGWESGEGRVADGGGHFFDGTSDEGSRERTTEPRARNLEQELVPLVRPAGLQVSELALVP